MKSVIEWLLGGIAGDDDDILQRALASIRKSEIARNILAGDRSKNIRIFIDHQTDTPYCNDKAIGLLPWMSIEHLVGDLAHEVAHIDQDSRLDFSPSNLSRDDFLIYRRIIEADADATALAICDQIAQSGDSAPLDALRVSRQRKDIAAAFYQSLDISDQSENRRRLPLQNSFFAWFDNPWYSSIYDAESLGILAHVAQKRPEEMRKWGTEKLTADAVRRIATLPGSAESYLPENDPRLAALLEPPSPASPISRNRPVPGC